MKASRRKPSFSGKIKQPAQQNLRRNAANAALARAEGFIKAGNVEGALGAFDEAIRLGLDARQVLYRKGACLSAAKRFAAALDVLLPLYGTSGNDYNIANLIGVTYRRNNEPLKAIEWLERCTQQAPEVPTAWQNLGNAYDFVGNMPQAIHAYEQLVKLLPDSVEANRSLGRQHYMAGDDHLAVVSLEKAYALEPSVNTLVLLVQVLTRLGRGDEALNLIETSPHRNARDIQIALGWYYSRKGETQKAIDVMLEIIQQDEGNLHANLQLANLYGDGDRENADKALFRAVKGHPESWEALDRLIGGLIRSRYGKEGDHIEAAYKASIEFIDRFPLQIPRAARALRTVFMRVLDLPRMAKTGDIKELMKLWLIERRHASVHYELGQMKTLQDRIDMVEWHREWGRKASEKITPVNVPPAPALHLGRKLRIGFLSSDLRHHPITYFALPLLEGYDKDKVEVYCYSFYEGKQSPMQKEIESKTNFRWWPRQPNDFVAENIAKDSLDMLFELGGSTAMNKLEVMAYRPARLGASWLGYPHSAGLEQIDYILVDPYIKPPRPELLIEKPFEMPESWVCLSRMFTGAPIEEGLPEDRRGYLTFGTANNPYKYSDLCLDLWAAVLRSVPNSRFLFVRPEASCPSFIANARAVFAARNVDPARIEFIGVRGAHMQHYNKMDISLDTAPHVGGTTTCESLWMCVPTITLAGPGFYERLSYSNIANAGLKDVCVAFNPKQYVEKATALAQDKALRAKLRPNMRQMIQNNPLGQPTRFTQNFYALAHKIASQ